MLLSGVFQSSQICSYCYVLSHFIHAQNGIFKYFMCIRILGVVKGQGVVIDI